ncbi:MAG TPA: lipid A biosynthesis acyltransferase [Veillonellaceae bacterium]|nr:lipid A biosynthesis acyltransferase [Veillonellaceae bacterium]
MKGTYAFLKSLSRFSCRLSPQGAERMGRILGLIFWTLVPPKRKQLAEKNILRAGITKNKREARRIARESSLRFGPMAVDMFRFPLLDSRNIRDIVTIEGSEYLDALKKEGKGCILAANHCGNWELEGAALALFGYPLLAVGMKQKNEEFDRFIREYRSIPGETVEYKTGIRDMYRRLKQGYFIGLLCDQDPGNAGIPADLFGEPTLTPTGPAHFSRLCEVPILMLFIHHTGNGHYHITLEPPFWTDSELPKKEAVLKMTSLINSRLEKWIRTYPEEWFWLHNRWKWTDRLRKQENKI